jgi:hypothetical protein
VIVRSRKSTLPREGAVRDSLPAATDVFANLPPARPDDEALRESIRNLRAEDRRLIGVLDDDPTGSQAVHDVQVVTVLDEDAYDAALDGPAGTCFVLTNSRSLSQRAAASLTTRAARGLISVADLRGRTAGCADRSDQPQRLDPARSLVRRSRGTDCRAPRCARRRPGRRAACSRLHRGRTADCRRHPLGAHARRPGTRGGD